MCFFKQTTSHFLIHTKGAGPFDALDKRLSKAKQNIKQSMKQRTQIICVQQIYTNQIWANLVSNFNLANQATCVKRSWNINILKTTSLEIVTYNLGRWWYFRTHFGVLWQKASKYLTIVKRRDGLETHQNYNKSHYLCSCSGLSRNEDLHRHVVIVFLPN